MIPPGKITVWAPISVCVSRITGLFITEIKSLGISPNSNSFSEGNISPEKSLVLDKMVAFMLTQTKS